MNKVTKSTKEEAKTTSRGEKCLAKFTAANGNVYGSLTLDIRKAGDYSQPLPVAVRVCHAGQKVFLRLGSRPSKRRHRIFHIDLRDELVMKI